MNSRAKALLAGAVIAFAGAAVAVGVYRHATREQRALDRAFGPGPKLLVAQGSLFGERWTVFAHEQSGLPCLVANDALFSGASCFRPGEVAGSTVDFTVWTGTIELRSGRVLRYAAIVGAAPPEVARVRFAFAGDVRADVRSREIRGFDARFFVRVLSGNLPEGSGTVEAFDAGGRPVPSRVEQARAP